MTSFRQSEPGVASFVRALRPLEELEVKPRIPFDMSNTRTHSFGLLIVVLLALSMPIIAAFSSPQEDGKSNGKSEQDEESDNQATDSALTQS